MVFGMTDKKLSKLKNFTYRLYAISSFMRVVQIQEIFQGGGGGVRGIFSVNVLFRFI